MNPRKIITINGIDITTDSLCAIPDAEVRQFIEEWIAPSDDITLHTSGSTGAPKPFLASKTRMTASARMTIDFLRLAKGSTAFLCMSPKYIAGKMMIVRAIVGNLNLLIGNVCGSPLRGETRRIDFAAMVPMQIYQSIGDGEQRLRAIGKIIIGGGAIDRQIEERLSTFGNEIYATYGMTETLSHIAMRRINGADASPYFSPLGGIKVSANAEQCLRISAPHLCAEELQTNDIADIRPDGSFRILGRRDNVICSGGVKIQIEQAEEIIRPIVKYPFAISSIPNASLGEEAVMVIEKDSAPSREETDALMSKIKEALPRYWSPRRIIALPQIPMTETSKIARKKLKDLLQRI